VAFLSKAGLIPLGDKGVNVTGEVVSIPSSYTGWNEDMRETSTIDNTKTVGAYLGLSATQVQSGVFF
jgi:hypothetical protein